MVPLPYSAGIGSDSKPWNWRLWDPKDEYSNRITAAAFLLLEAERVNTPADNNLD